MQILNVRCAICDAVSSREIETNPGDYSNKAFLPDPSSPNHHICFECKEVHEELMGDYMAQDDVWGWEADAEGPETPTNVIPFPVEKTNTS